MTGRIQSIVQEGRHIDTEFFYMAFFHSYCITQRQEKPITCSSLNVGDSLPPSLQDYYPISKLSRLENVKDNVSILYLNYPEI